MKLQVLISTVNANPIELVKRMHIDSDAIIINQCNKVSYNDFVYNDHLIKIFSFNERGIGLSRNNALMRADSDIVLFADDDEVFEENYEKKIIDEFKKRRTADMIVFNIKSTDNQTMVYDIKQSKRLHKYNSLKFGTVRLAVKTAAIRKSNVFFSLLFGGGAKYGSGEDSIFIYDCLKNKFKVYTSPVLIASVDFSSSTWFSGYNKKYYYDKGVLFYFLHKNLATLFIFIYLLRHKEKSELTGYDKFKIMLKGKNDIRK